MKSIAVIQARTNSSRLPGKVLLPVNGIPLVVLAARRAANTGREIVVATSSEATDDALAELLSNSGIRCYRGSLENTLQRFIDALAGYDDDTIVFRLTADNVFPDGTLLDEMEEAFCQHGLKYLCCNGENSGLPYGMSTEVTRLRYLREAAASTQSRFDQEHVTPYIRRTFGETYFERYKHLNKGHYRCTVDCLDDYLSIQHVFSGIADPVLVPARVLIDRLRTAPYQPLQSAPAKKLVLGTAQLGFTYGIANQSGQPDQATAEKLLKTAIANGSTSIDTARTYGNSEDVIGNALKTGWEGRSQVITKLSPLSDCPLEASPATIHAHVDASVFRSCTALRTQQVDVLMLHRTAHLSDWSGAVWKRLIEHKSNGFIKRLGASVQNSEELELALATTEVELIQMPYNIFDYRWDALIPKIRKTKQHRPLTIHVRSSLLQGLLATSTPEYWRKANVLNPAPVIEWLVEQHRATDRSSVADLCLSFVKSLDWVDGVVVGMESYEQLTENIKIFSHSDLTEQQMRYILTNRPMLGEITLNPAHWGK